MVEREIDKEEMEGKMKMMGRKGRRKKRNERKEMVGVQMALRFWGVDDYF